MHQRQLVVQPADTSYRYIPLTQNKIAIVDADDFASLSLFNWCARYDSHTDSWYAYRGINLGNHKIITVTMHRVVMQAVKGEQVDHHNHDTLDNRKHNLRKCSHWQNSVNKRNRKRVGFKGATWNSQRKSWDARIGYKGKVIRLGKFTTPEDAARAYDEAAKKYFGEFAELNTPQGQPSE